MIDADYEIIEPAEGQALVKRGMEDYVPELRRNPAQVKHLIEEVEGLVKEHMREGIDYGTIPGTPKPTLYKPGAERLMRFFGMGSVVEQVRCIEDWKEGLFYYQYRVGVGPITENGIVPIAWCEGSANSRERKWSRANAPDILNTIQKMSQKRAMVGAVLIATNTSSFFTQDTEDLPRELLQQQHATAAPAGPQADGPDFIWPKGKHTGERLGDLDVAYLSWAVENLPGELQTRAKAEQERRADEKA